MIAPTCRNLIRFLLGAWLCLFCLQETAEAQRARVRFTRPKVKPKVQTGTKVQASLRSSTGGGSVRTRTRARPEAETSSTRTRTEPAAGEGAGLFGTGTGKGTGASAGARTWEVTPARTAKVMRHRKFGTFHKSKSDATWWSQDRAGHGGSVWKVFKEGRKGLEWIADADASGNYIKGKHKGDTGMHIPWSQLGAVK